MSELLIWICLFCIGYFTIFFAADIFIDNLKDICIIYNVSPFIIGLLVLGIDPEESIASIVAAMNGLSYVAVGNVIGNSIFALTLCFALPAFFYKIELKSISQFYFMILYTAMVLILFAFIIYLGFFIFGILLLFLYIIYLFRNIKHVSKQNELEIIEIDEIREELKKENQKQLQSSKLKKLLFIGISFLGIFIGGELLIYATEHLIILTKIPESLFGFIIIAFVTNVEELTLVLKAVKKKSVEIGLGAMIGKLIWNLTFTFGVSGIIALNIKFAWVLFWNWLILFLLIIYFNFLSKRGKMGREDAFILTILLIIFLVVNIAFF